MNSNSHQGVYIKSACINWETRASINLKQMFTVLPSKCMNSVLTALKVVGL